MSIKFANFDVSPNNLRLEFDIFNVDVSIVNAIRRVILSEIPNVAIRFDPYNPEHNDIKILTNTSTLHNEFMGHRISLIPLHLSEKTIQDYDKSMYTFRLDVKNTGNDVLTVTTKDIQVFDSDNVHQPKLTKKIFPPDPITKEYILITKLKPNNYNTDEGEAFVAEFQASKGIAKQHSRWCPVSTCTFENIRDEAQVKKAFEQLMKDNANASVEEKNKLKYQFDTLESYRYFHKNAQEEPIAFRFKIQSECKLAPHYLFEKAIDILINKIDIVLTCTIHVLHPDQHLFMIQINDEDHTLGNLFQSMVYNLFVQQDKHVSFIGYFQPHPLEPSIVFKTMFKNASNEKQVKEVLETLCSDIKSHLKKIKQSWENVMNIFQANNK